MTHFRRILCLFPLAVVVGCTGQDVSGAWHGAFPLPGAKDCRIRIYNSSRFDLTSRDNRWLGAGLWKLDKKKLTFQFLALAEQGEKVAPRTVSVSFSGVGNRLTTELGLWERLH